MHSIFFIFLFLLPIISFSQVTLPSVVVSEKHFEIDQQATLSNMEFIDGLVVQDFYFADSMRALESLPEFHMAQSGGVGQYSSFWFRGSPGNKLLVLVDGMEMNDPTESSRSSMFELLSLSQIESIEILKGAQSGIYGADAMSGIINIRTKEMHRPMQAYSVEFGSYDRKRFQIYAQNRHEKHRYKLSFDTLTVAGPSAALDGNEDDSSEKNNILLMHQWENEQLLIKNQLMLLMLDADIDRGAGSSNDDPNNYSSVNNKFWNGQILIKNAESKTKISAQYKKFDRNYRNYSDPNNSDNQKDEFDGVSQKLTLAHTFHGLTFGVDYEKEMMDTKSVGTVTNSSQNDLSIESKSLFFDLNFDFIERLTHSFSTRYDNFSNGNQVTTYRFLNKYQIDSKQHVGLSNSTGFKNPTLYQLFDTTNGNKNLKPEEVQDVEIFYQWSERKFQSKLALFKQDYEQLITWDTTYKNIDKLNISGIEFSQSIFELFGNWKLGLTFLEIEKNEKKQTDRPGKKYSIEYQNGNWYARWLYIGERTNLRHYEITDVGYRHNLARGDLHFKVNNLFNRNYQEVKGYSQLGMNFVIQYQISSY